MLSFQNLYSQFQDLAQDTNTDALTFAKTHINVGYHLIESELGSFYTEEEFTDLTEASVSSYPTPDQFIRLKVAYVTVSSIRYVMEEIFDEDEWQALKSSQANQTSNIAQYIIVRRDRFEIYPTPTTAGNTITLRAEAGSKDLSADDYTTGTITTLANGGTAVTASGSTFTSAMAGRYLKITNHPVWIKIASFGTTTTLTLDKPYSGIAISAGSENYTIGEMPRIPESLHTSLVWYALKEYYEGFKQNEDKAKYYNNKFEFDLKRAKTTYSKRYSTNYIPGNRQKKVMNSNLFPSGMTY